MVFTLNFIKIKLIFLGRLHPFFNNTEYVAPNSKEKAKRVKRKSHSYPKLVNKTISILLINHNSISIVGRGILQSLNLQYYFFAQYAQ